VQQKHSLGTRISSRIDIELHACYLDLH